MDGLFPQVPENLADSSDEEIAQLLEDHEAAAALIDADDEEFLKGLGPEEIIEQYSAGVEQIKKLRVEHKERLVAYDNFVAKREELKALRQDDDEGDGDGGEDPSAEADVEVVAEAEQITEEAAEAETVEEPELVTASVETPKPRYARTPPAPAKERIVVSEQQTGTALVAAGGYREKHPGALTASALAEVQREACVEHGPAEKNGKQTFVDGPHGRAVFDGPRVKTARADYEFPSDRQLTGGDDDIEKIRAVMPNTVTVFGQPGGLGGEALTASGGLCAPGTPIYTMPNFGTEAEPVWDALPVFQANRGAVNVPTATYIADITSAISSISEANDALGGTFATKSCQDLDCPEYTETAVQILAHCREYGNLNARAWPEKIAHENALTMQALSRVSEGFMLDRIKALSINVTASQTLGSLIDLVYAITREVSSIRYLLRMPAEARFRALMPRWVLDLLVVDTVSTQFDRFRDQQTLAAYLRSIGIDPVFYLDTPSTGTSQGFSAETASAIDDFPDDVQWAIYPEGTFLGIDMGTLELGIVRDSTLNATNDFQVFGERFRNLVLLGPAQAARWVTSTVCPTGEFPALATALSC